DAVVLVARLRRHDDVAPEVRVADLPEPLEAAPVVRQHDDVREEERLDAEPVLVRAGAQDPLPDAVQDRPPRSARAAQSPSASATPRATLLAPTAAATTRSARWKRPAADRRARSSRTCRRSIRRRTLRRSRSRAGRSGPSPAAPT